MRSFTRQRGAFTLIELLIVVAIIGILAAIAVPNFLNARMRATIARMETDVKALGDALMMYRIDHRCYFEHQGGNPLVEWAPLTTPVAYIATIPLDPFRNPDLQPIYQSMSEAYGYSSFGPLSCRSNWSIKGLGPDKDEDFTGTDYTPETSDRFKQGLYNPSNGIYSSGDVMHASWAGLSF
ncbi:MAG TPA: prepilin-type N-terminal cleavage/methylation domain-containing protein [bacterium]|nr:prepilin-type N-terminal cleavage/methylation domain-containing protein [bacterium]